MNTSASLPTAVLLCALLSPGCAETLPDEDRRIYAAAPAEKLSADVLWKDYAADTEAANGRYWGKVIEMSGNITAVSSEPPHAFLLFGYEDQPGVRAVLLDDEAETIIATVKIGDRVTLRCYCEGFDEFVRLKSCIGRR